MPTAAIAKPSAEKQEIVENILDIIKASNSAATVVLSYGLDDRDRIVGKYRAGTQVYEYEINDGAITDTPLSDRRNDSYLRGYYGDRPQIHDWIERFDAAPMSKKKKCTPGKSRECGSSCIPLKNTNGEPRKCRFDPPAEVKQKIKDTTKKIKERQTKRGKTAEPERGGSLATIAKPEEKKAPKSKQQEIDEKYASVDPTDADIDNWLKETVEERAKPDRKTVEAEVLQSLKEKSGMGSSVQSKRQWAEARYEGQLEEQTKLKERTGSDRHQASEFSSMKWYKQELKKAQKAASNPKTTEAKRKEAEERAVKMEENIRTDPQRSQAYADKLNAEFDKPKAERIKDFEREFDDVAKKVMNSRQEAHQALKKKGKEAKAAFEEMADDVAREIDPAMFNMGISRREVIRNYLKEIQKGSAEEGLGLESGIKLTAQELKAAYRKAAASSHPDAGGSNEAFRKVNESYERIKAKYGYDSFDGIYELYADRSDSFWRGYYQRMAETQGLYVEV